MTRLLSLSSLLSSTALSICCLCPAANGENLPPGTYVYLGESVGTANPKLLTVTSGGKIKWQNSDSVSSNTRDSATKMPNLFFHPSAAPSPSAVLMPKIGGQSIAPMSNSYATADIVKAGGPASTPINFPSTAGLNASGSVTPVPVGGGARSLGYDRGPGPSPRPTRAGRGSGGGGAMGGGSPGIAVAPSVARASGGSNTGEISKFVDSLVGGSSSALEKDSPSKPFFDNSEYPKRKWKSVGVAGHPDGVAQLSTIFEDPESVGSNRNVQWTGAVLGNGNNQRSDNSPGRIKLRLALSRVPITGSYDSLTVSLLDKDGFNILVIPMNSFHQVTGSSLMESQAVVAILEANYKKAVSYSVH